MHARLFLALFVSIALVGGALWTRLSNNATVKYELALVEPSGGEGEFLDYFSNQSSKELAKSPEAVSASDLLGQNLLTDYIGLASSGRATDENVTSLTNKYIEGIPALLKADTKSYNDLKTTSNNQENLTKYAEALAKIYVEHADRINKTLKGGAASPETYYEMIGKSASIYKDTASKLLILPVPSLIAAEHLELINTHLLSASAAQSISEMNKDSTLGFAGLVNLNDNAGREVTILEQIVEIIKSNGA